MADPRSVCSSIIIVNGGLEGGGDDGGGVFWVYSHKSDSTEPGSRLSMLSSTCGIVVILTFDSCASTTRQKC